MPEKNTVETTPIIHDVVIISIKARSGHMEVFRYSDHLLPQVALVQHIVLGAGERTALRLRPEVDEAWVLLEGSGVFHWYDLRQHSPSFEKILKHTSQSPTMALAPFGVAFGVEAIEECRLLRLAAYEEVNGMDVHSLDWADDE